MGVFSSADIARFSQQGEEDFTVSRYTIEERLALDIVAGTSTYVLPDYLYSIKQVTWKGWRLNPMPQRDLRNSLFSGTEGGRPFHFVYNNIGQLKIQLWPVPQESITADQTHLYDTNIDSQCIVEFFRAPDGSSFTVPVYIRRRLLKSYIMKELYTKEGKGQNMKAAKYWTQMNEKLVADYIQLLDDLHLRPRNLNSQNSPASYYKVPPPRLPLASFGVGVTD